MTLTLVFRLLIGSILGGIIGLEREYRAKEAGFRTHFLVALGSTLFILVSQYGFSGALTGEGVSVDVSRVAAQVASGIGFIGAGTIIFQRHAVRGLTTAAGMWATAAIGLAIGGGMIVVGIAATVAVILCLETTNFLTSRVGHRTFQVQFSSVSTEQVNTVLALLRKRGAEIESYRMTRSGHGDGGCTVEMAVNVRRRQYKRGITDLMNDLDGVSIELVD